MEFQTAGDLEATNQELRAEVEERRRLEENNRKGAEQRVTALEAQLARLLRVQTMGEMASGLAHELNQPLGAITVRADVMATKLRLAQNVSREDLLELFDFIGQQAYRAGEIIRRMRRFVGRPEPERTPMDLEETIREAAALTENDMRHAGVSFALRTPPALPKVSADRIQLQQVVLNLMRNALEAMEDAPGHPRVLTIEVQNGGGCLEVAVRDNGCGIADRDPDQLFQAFYTTKPGGMGMGLAISRSIIESHGGRMWAAQNPGGGTTLAFTLPVGDGQGAA